MKLVQSLESRKRCRSERGRNGGRRARFLASRALNSPFDFQAVFVASVLTLFTSSQGVLTTLSQTNGGYLYDYGTVPSRGVNEASGCFHSVYSVLLFITTLRWPTLTYVDTSTYQYMGNLKIVTTAILFRAFLKKKLSRIQWIAIVLLTLGTTTSQFQVLFSRRTAERLRSKDCQGLLVAPIQGYLLAVLSACLSGLAGVYTEYLMKKNDDTPELAERATLCVCVLSIRFGVLFNGLRLSLDDFNDAFSKEEYGSHASSLVIISRLCSW
ncbi:hypothetical protein R1sor_027047 [Riccia sorocarpa]|uniref:Uncharacterized protein n=1 Tax=Riccia sorocarpa TaxID=122646 RepID=A0ABD3GF93_9MARC